ncbi:hypothetical protein Xen7305DRAFT_00046610 [Xenococcus sp. PCC 7305]|uniref:hypothetical protein n=1 Tax=Xenococcus sp. PCC 7305 TaxID=102125 RepID=UPI0002ABC2AA|nr:hypothetical protein [Xenococcus sp. PCC 7305]ELS04925.1 hypothetical protein Xen7305DRAFT_00046610 [Xenococcus sp. PCC 7305]
MVALESQQKRNSIGIDSLERALVYAFSMLRASIVGESNQGVADQKIKIGENISDLDNALLVLEAKLDYDSFLVSSTGDNLILHIKEFAGTTPYETGIKCASSGGQFQPIPPAPSILHSLEQYLYWSAASLLASLPVDQDNIKIKRFEHNQNGAYVQIKASLPFDYKAVLLGSNYVCAVQRIATGYEFFELPSGSIIDNNSIIDNSYIFAN